MAIDLATIITEDKAPAPQARRIDFWTAADEQFCEAIEHVELTYKTTYWINVIIVAIGVVLVAFSLAISVVRGVNPSTLTFAGLGIGDFVALFLVNPQKRLMVTLGRVGQLTLIIKIWNTKFMMVNAETYDNTTNNYKTMNSDERKEFLEEFDRITEEALTEIEKYFEADDGTDSSRNEGAQRNDAT